MKVFIAEGRGFIQSSQSKYDLIQLALLDSFSASSAGVYALSESYLYTKEAVKEYIRHLNPEGILCITRWLKLPPRDGIKLFATAVESLQELGDENISRESASLVLPATNAILVADFVSALAENDAAKAVQLLGEYADQGIDIPRFSDDCIAFLRQLLFASATLLGTRGVAL